ncbi:MAG: peptidoglycan DD-metalloendopeptidase family protein [Bacteroidota bacterium]
MIQHNLISSLFSRNIFVLACFLILSSDVAFPQKTKEKLQEDKEKIEDDIAYTNKLLTETKKNKQISLNQLIILNNKINQREELITTISTEIGTLDDQMLGNAKETSKLTTELKKIKEAYAKMIYYAYKNRNAYARLMFLFASSDINQAFLRLKYLNQYAKYRRKQAELIVNATLLLNEKLAELKGIKTNKSTLLKTKEAEKTILAQEKEEKNTSVKTLQQKEKDLKKTIKLKEKEAKKLQQSIEAIIAEEIKKATTNTTTNTSVSTTIKELGLTETEIALSASFSNNKGKLPWPTEKGIVTSTFGVHTHPVLDIKVKNNGIDISTNEGSKARAVFEGKVTGVVNIPGANKAVIIRHGEYLTVYSNLSDVSVKTGALVKVKQEIGTIATDAEEAKTELHFEVWYGKTLTDPIGWLLPN